VGESVAERALVCEDVEAASYHLAAGCRPVELKHVDQRFPEETKIRTTHVSRLGELRAEESVGAVQAVRDDRLTADLGTPCLHSLGGRSRLTCDRHVLLEDGIDRACEG